MRAGHLVRCKRALQVIALLALTGTALAQPAPKPAIQGGDPRLRTPAQPAVPPPVAHPGATTGDAVHITSGVTLEQVLAKPDATAVVMPDGTRTTVGEVRRKAQARAALAAGRATRQLTTNKIGVRSAGGVAKVAALAQALAQENSAAGTVRESKLRTITPQQLGAKPSDGVTTVNRKVIGWVVTPGGHLTIEGVGFGDTLGEVEVIGRFPQGAVKLEVVNWRADTIYALFPLGVRGVPDHAIDLRVLTAARRTFPAGAGRFYAAREEITLHSGIPRVVAFTSARYWQAAMDDAGHVDRLMSGGSLDCPRPSYDSLATIDPGNGFTVVGLAMTNGRTDTGNGDRNGEAGNHLFSPGYSFGAWDGPYEGHYRTVVSWGVFRSHSSPSFLGSSRDVCESNYQLEVTLSGPAGVQPF